MTTTQQTPVRPAIRRAATLRTAGLALAVAATLAACGHAAGGTAGTASGAPVTTGASSAGQPVQTASGTASTRAVSLLPGRLAVRASASAQAPVVAQLPPTTSLGAPRVLLVDPAAAPVAGWVRVLLPVRPNGSAGWVRAQDVRLEPDPERIVVDLAGRRLKLYVQGRPVLDVPVAVGAGGTPTPTGRDYVTDRVRPSNPHGAYGPFALGLSAHSDTLQSFGDGDAQIGVHGTDQPGSIGHAVTHGCIRLRDSDAAALSAVPLGTPVTIA
jgi:lipoprotein-anchoring transpeptidase ErfK/SrfK